VSGYLGRGGGSAGGKSGLTAARESCSLALQSVNSSRSSTRRRCAFGACSLLLFCGTCGCFALDTHARGDDTSTRELLGFGCVRHAYVRARKRGEARAETYTYVLYAYVRARMCYYKTKNRRLTMLTCVCILLYKNQEYAARICQDYFADAS
jgi:hypothetical protein